MQLGIGGGVYSSYRRRGYRRRGPAARYNYRRRGLAARYRKRGLATRYIGGAC